ncbi:MAG: hypothetical protein WCC17_06915 [Candidatus Nitrosopolaris sp.]
MTNNLEDGAKMTFAMTLDLAYNTHRITNLTIIIDGFYKAGAN